LKKFASILSILLFISFNINKINATAQSKVYSQGFYTMKDLNLYEGATYTVQNSQPYDDGMLIIIDSEERIQLLLHIPPYSTKYTLPSLKSDYQFIIHNNVRLTFS